MTAPLPLSRQSGPEVSVRGVLYRFAVRLTGNVLAICLKLWAATWRKDVSELERLDRMLASGDRVLAVFWHGKYFPLFALAAGRKGTVFTAASFRGDVIAQICKKFGYTPLVISSHSHGLEQIEDSLRSQAGLAALALDGPLGPFHTVKSGALHIASDLGFRILPLDVVSHPKFVLRLRWDRREMPCPFASVKVRVGRPVDLPRDLNNDDIHGWKAILRAGMDSIGGDRSVDERTAAAIGSSGTRT